MAPLALALQLALASPGLSPPQLAPRLDPGPFGGGELFLASIGTLGGDALVLGAGYLTLRLFADGTISPTAENFRSAAYVLAASALLVPPLTSVILAKLGARGPVSGRFWKALLLAAAGQAAALAVGYYAAPHFWLIVPAQLATVTVGTSYGLHWGSGSRRTFVPAGIAPPAVRREPSDPADAPPTAAAFGARICPDA